MTSANVVEYQIMLKATGEVVGHHRQNYMCATHWDELAMNFTPIENYTIQSYGYDEEDQEWEGEVRDLYDFLVDVGFIELR